MYTAQSLYLQSPGIVPVYCKFARLKQSQNRNKTHASFHHNCYVSMFVLIPTAYPVTFWGMQAPIQYYFQISNDNGHISKLELYVPNIKISSSVNMSYTNSVHWYTDTKQCTLVHSHTNRHTGTWQYIRSCTLWYTTHTAYTDTTSQCVRLYTLTHSVQAGFFTFSTYMFLLHRAQPHHFENIKNVF